MREQSHKDEMASALHGDFARLRARGIETTLAPQTASGEPIVADEPVAAGTPAAPAVAPVTAPQAGWLARLRAR